jgi:hypothetical protein
MENMKPKYFISAAVLLLFIVIVYIIRGNSVEVDPLAGTIVGTSTQPQPQLKNIEYKPTEVTPFVGTSASTSTNTQPQLKNQEQKSFVTITSDNTYGTGDSLFMGNKKSQEFIHISIRGEVREFRYVSISYDGNKITIGKTISEVPTIVNKNITIGTALPEGVPYEMIIWKSSSGKEYSFVFAYNGESGKINETIEMQ